MGGFDFNGNGAFAIFLILILLFFAGEKDNC